jgi:hypothetical protein
MTDDLTRDERAENEHSLDPNETWGQGPDASHPLRATDPIDDPRPADADTDDDAEDAVLDEMPLA